MLRNLKTFAQHISGYPKIIYVPFLLFTSAAYGFNSVKSSRVPYQELPVDQQNEVKDYQSLKRWIVSTSTQAVTEVIATKEVKRQGLGYLERMFKNKQVHDALIVLLKGGVKDERFVSDSKEFGKEWISTTIQA